MQSVNEHRPLIYFQDEIMVEIRSSLGRVLHVFCVNIAFKVHSPSLVNVDVHNV